MKDRNCLNSSLTVYTANIWILEEQIKILVKYWINLNPILIIKEFVMIIQIWMQIFLNILSVAMMNSMYNFLYSDFYKIL